ncbi:nucleolar protein 6 [Impatiens glandulifera]|uniref:nucleolar protein 6 n=1 Tax=Impatiens glandulifera TaxID=253017 RepID=UPI001FB1A056|nr:nucleolar protein 6 [Impatiens glandulifera]
MSSADRLDFKANELLKDVQFDYSPEFTQLVNDTVSGIKASIDGIPEDSQITADVVPGFIRDIGADKVEFRFKKPSSIEIGGSYAMRCMVKPDITVDLFIRMPKECFHEKDYLNYRYHGKRCLYLGIIKKHLNLSSIADRVEWSYFQNEVRKPLLILYPAAKLAELPGFCMRIIPTVTSVFDVTKLSLQRNNIRALNEGDALQPTPKYNISILEDHCIEGTYEFIKKTFSGWKELGAALILLKVWARQRSSIYTHDGLNGFLISAIVAYLATKSGKNRFNSSMSAMQMFRVTMDFIATSKVWDSGLIFHPQGKSKVLTEEMKKAMSSFPVVMLDSSSGINFASRMTKNAFLELRSEAALALTCFNKCRDSGFDELFMSKLDFPAKYDYCIRLNLKGASKEYKTGFCLDDECWRLVEQEVLALMHEAFDDRAKFIRVLWRNTISGGSLESGVSMFDREPLFIGILAAAPEKALRVVDIGPNADNKDEAVKFRKFWGDKAELRRFKDGRIAESTVWVCKPWERHLIIKKISEHILGRHLSLSKENITTVADQLDFSLLYGAEDPIAFSASLMEAFDILSKRLRLLSDIPLKITSVQPLDPAFRHTSVFPPEPHPVAVEKGVNLKKKQLTSTCLQPLEVMIQLEGSGNWPKDDIALEKTKSAFLLKIGESLQNLWGMTCNATEEDVVVFTSGYAFSLRILHERGLRQAGSNQTRHVPSTDSSLYIRGQHSSMINGLQGLYPIFGPVVRLAKRWVAAHLFSSLLREEVVELLVAHLFLKPMPFCAPGSRITGLLRFLRLLSEYDWTFSPLIIDINGDLTPQDEKEINDNFMVNRKSNEEKPGIMSPSMFLATSYDKTSEAWTRLSPTTTELKRIAAYARSSASYLTKLISQDNFDSSRWECIFRTPLNNYDAVVLLHRDKLAYPQRLLFPSELNQGKHVVSGKPSKSFHPFLLPKGNLGKLKENLLVNFDPLKYFIGDLEKEFPNTFKVWYDSIGGDAVGLMWERLDSSKKRKRGDEETDEEEKDIMDVLKNVGSIGKGFVRSVHLLKAPKQQQPTK